jgi:nitrous oxidase accessory protein NosD
MLFVSSPFIISSGTDITKSFGIGNTIYVDDDNTIGPWDGTREHPFNRIEIATEHAQHYDHIYVLNGTYFEYIIIDKPIILEGEDQDNVIIDGSYNPYVISVETSSVEIDRITIRNSGGMYKNAGILLKADTGHISNCSFFRTKTGISVDTCENIKISNCLFYQNGEGVFLNDISNSLIENSFFTHNGIGIHGYFSNNLTLINCSATINGIGIFLNKVTSVQIDFCALFNNNDNQGGLFLQDCQGISMNNSFIYHNGFGVKTDNCHNIAIDNSTFQCNTHFGMYIANRTTYLTVYNSEFVENLRFSIRVEDSEITIHTSNLYNAIMGIYAFNATCHVQKNYWGSPFGPALFDRAQKDRIYAKQTKVSWIPWFSEKQRSIGTTWELNTNIPDIQFKFQPEISFEETDTDKDGVPDWWEKLYGYDPQCKDGHMFLDPDNDGLTNIQECYAHIWGADPFNKDLFWEMDWMESQTQHQDANKPSETLLSEIIDSFAAHNISLHVDVGELSGGEIIPYKATFTYADLRDYYWEYFLHNTINNPRKGIFHYGIICDNGPGPGFAFIGWDCLDGFCISADMLGEKLPLFNRERFIVGGAVHELGHTLGLTVDDHFGNDNTIAAMPFSKQWFLYIPYRSCMNYWYTYKILTFSDGHLGPTDFDDWGHMDLSFFKNTHFTPQ